MSERQAMSYVAIGTVTLGFSVLVFAMTAFLTPGSVTVSCSRSDGTCQVDGVTEGERQTLPVEAMSTARLRREDRGEGRRIAVDGPRGLTFLSRAGLSEAIQSRHRQVVDELKAFGEGQGATLELSYPVGGGLTPTFIWSGVGAAVFGGGFVLRGMLVRRRPRPKVG